MAPVQRPEGHELDIRRDDQDVPQSLTDGTGQLGVRFDLAGELHHDRERRLLLDPGHPRLDEHVTADAGCERSHDVANRRREHVYSADDEHVVGSADATDAWARAAACAGRHAHLHVVARTEPEKGSGALAEVRQDELAARTVLELKRRPGLGIDELRVDESARTEMHAVLFLALAPE